MKSLKRIAILTFCTGLLLSATSCAVYVPSDNAEYGGHHHFFHRNHHSHVEIYGESHERNER